MNSSKKYTTIIFLVSLTSILMQLLLTRIFSVILWYHFAFMAVSIAMLGISIAGLTVYFQKHKITETNTDSIIFKSSFIAPIVLLIVFLIVFNTRIYLRANLNDMLYLSFIYFIFILPFFFLAIISSIILSNYSENISSLYFFDLIGAGIGCIIFIPLINYLGAENSIILIAFIMSLIPLKIALKSINQSIKTVIISLILTLSILSLFILNLNEYKGLKDYFKIKYVKGKFENDIEFSRWNSFSRVAVYPTRFVDWGLSEVYQDSQLPELKTMDIDACAGMALVSYRGNDKEVEFLKYSITALAYLLKNDGAAAIIGAGAGKDVLGAKICGIKTIYAVDINPIIYDVVNNYYGNFTNHLYNQKGVYFSLEDGRSFIRRAKKKFNIIQLSMVDTWAAINSGALALAENTLYTVEAFKDYFNKLEDDGIFTVTRFISQPKPREELRIVTLAIEALKKNGITDYHKNFIIISHQPYQGKTKYNTVTFLIKKKPFTLQEISELNNIVNNLKFKIEYSPLSNSPEPNYFSQLLYTQNLNKFYNDYEFDISPSTDDRPFFFHLLKPKDFLKALEIRDGHSYNYIAVLTLVCSFVFIFITTAVFILLPLIIKIQKSLNDFKIINILMYFSCLGVGFMLIETSLIQRYILLLGHPIYALSIVLFSMLIFSGVGSYLTNFLPTKLLSEYIIKAITILIALLIFYNLFLDAFFNSILEFNQSIKIIIAIATLIAPSIMLGMPFPLAIKILSTTKNENMIPWCLAVNGANSVLGSLAAFIIAMNFGFTFTLFVSIAFYGCALFLSIYLKQK